MCRVVIDLLVIGRLGLRLGMSAMAVGVASLIARKVVSTPSRMPAAGFVPGGTSMFSTRNCLKLALNLEGSGVLDVSFFLKFMVAPSVSRGDRNCDILRGVAPDVAAPSFFWAAAFAAMLRIRRVAVFFNGFLVLLAVSPSSIGSLPNLHLVLLLSPVSGETIVSLGPLSLEVMSELFRLGVGGRTRS